jgi:hypothetical protein
VYPIATLGSLTHIAVGYNDKLNIAQKLTIFIYRAIFTNPEGNSRIGASIN